MNKLMIAASAMLCGAVTFAAGEITSKNVVGYAGSNLDLSYGAVMTGAQFTHVGDGTGSIKLTDLLPVAADPETDLEDNIQLQLLTNGGKTIADKNFMWDGSAWYAVAGGDVSKVTFGAGQGLWIFNYSGEAVAFQSAGEVSVADVLADLDLSYGAVAVANSFPTEINLTDITPVPENPETDLEDNIQLQLLTNGGKTIADKNFMYDGSEWYAVAGGDVSKVTFGAGQGLWVFNYSGEPVQLRIPAPEF